MFTKSVLLVIGFVCFTISILWFVNSNESLTPVVLEEQSAIVNKANQEEQEDNSFWKQLIPKTSVQKRDEVRALRQQELAMMIGELHGITRATVALSQDKGHSIGQSHQPTTACVTVEPEYELLPQETVQAIRNLVAGATLGLDANRVVVINNRTGSICTDAQQRVETAIDTTALQHKIENALGLVVATVAVTMEYPRDNTTHIPWRNELQPTVQVTVPRSWLKRRSEQVGTSELVLSSIQDIVHRAAPSSQYSIAVIQDEYIVPVAIVTNETYAKQIGLLIGLCAVLFSGIAVDRRRKPQIEVVVQQTQPNYEARRILRLNHAQARVAIDALEGPYKLQVLQAIVSSDDMVPEPPVVQIPSQQTLELTKCG